MKGQPIEWEKIFTNNIFDNDLMPSVNKSHNSAKKSMVSTAPGLKLNFLQRIHRYSLNNRKDIQHN